MKFVTVLIIIAIVIAYFMIIDCIGALTSVFTSKAKSNRIDYEIKKRGNPIEKIEFTEKYIELVDRLITIEIENTLRTYVALGTKYELTSFDSDVKDICNTVFNAIKTEDLEVFFTSDGVVTSEYFMMYITKTSTFLFLQAIKNYNNLIKK